MPETTLNSLSVVVLILALLGVWLYRLRYIDRQEFYEPLKDLKFDGSSYLTIPVNWVLSEYELLFALRFKTATPDGMLYLNKVYDDKFYCVYLEKGQLYLNKGLFDKNKVQLWSENLSDNVPHDIRLYWAFTQFVVEVDLRPLKYVTPPNTLPLVNGRHIYIGGGPTHLRVPPYQGCIYFIQTPVETLTYLNFDDGTLPAGVKAVTTCLST